MKNASTSIIILAAGNSSRLGLPKQLLQYKNKSFLKLIAEKSLEAKPADVIVVLGFSADQMKHELDGLPARIVLNHEWMEGIASSIRAGISAVHPQAESALIALCDQPAVTTELLSQLIASCSIESPIAATEYNQIVGVPACFERSIFPELLQLQGDTGAKPVIAKNLARVAVHPFPQAAIDVDTPEDFRDHGFVDE